MKKIKSISEMAFILRENHLEITQITSELGIYSYMICDDKSILHEEVTGYVVRSKVYHLIRTVVNVKVD